MCDKNRLGGTPDGVNRRIVARYVDADARPRNPRREPRPITRPGLTRSDVIRFGTDRFRVYPWQGDGTVALVAPVVGSPPATTAGVNRCLTELSNRGVAEIVTGALAQSELPGFLQAGFTVRERLHLLSLDLLQVPVDQRRVDQERIRLRRARRTDRPAVLAVDGAAFDSFWRLDRASLADALEATAASRFRVTTGAPLGGYLITGRAGARGYLQRLAVDPLRQRTGIGTALVVDALRWLRRHGIQQAVVNTQESNAPALAMYERLGFRREPEGLAVLTKRSFDPT